MRKFLENTDIYKAAGRILLHSVTEAMCNISIHHSCIKGYIDIYRIVDSCSSFLDVAKNLMDLSMESEYFKISTVTTFPLVQAILTVKDGLHVLLKSFNQMAIKLGAKRKRSRTFVD